MREQVQADSTERAFGSGRQVREWKRGKEAEGRKAVAGNDGRDSPLTSQRRVRGGSPAVVQSIGKRSGDWGLIS